MSVPILTFHDLAADAALIAFAPDRFTALMARLAKTGWQTICLTEYDVHIRVSLQQILTKGETLILRPALTPLLPDQVDSIVLIDCLHTALCTIDLWCDTFLSMNH